MRNLSLSSYETTSLSGVNFSATALDLDQKVLYVASERQNFDADVEVEIWRMGLDSTGAFVQDQRPSLVTMFSATCVAGLEPASQIACFRINPESNQLSLVMRGGDIGVLSLDHEEPKIEVEGTVESGIFGACWGPDDSLVALVTGDEKLILMTSTFDVLSEAALNTSEFGEDAPINVGWGSKQTQFHGSAGKAAAQAPSSSQALNIGSSPDDDNLPRISWRGDGAFFVVSALSPVTSSTNDYRRRVLRVYDRQAALQSTSESVAGLEHTLAWRPSGNLIAGTQRFGFEGGGAGKKERHDVVFFERNGLRHGEHGLRESARTATKTGGEERKWDYKVRELSWSSDSNVMSVWIAREEGDVVQLWTMGNYHYYLKQEISTPRSTSVEPSRFTSVSWHPEDALALILTTTTQIIRRTYAWETFASSSFPPNDSGSVAVLDGDKILLTPFRLQNIPPPMSSHQLSVGCKDDNKSLDAPVHISFSSAQDILGVLWESGRIELWDLHTRLESGRGKVMGPILTWSGTVEPSKRQIAVTTSGALIPEKSLARVTILGSDLQGSDVVEVVEILSDLTAKNHSIVMPSQGGRLVSSDDAIYWQASNGAIYQVDPSSKATSKISSFSDFCFASTLARITDSGGAVSDARIFVGLSNAGKLATSDETGAILTLATNANSFVIASGFVIFTTTAHEAHFAPLKMLYSILKSIADGAENPNIPDWEKRRVERGSKIVTAVPSMMSLVLQMPRGNLETVNPRPLVMAVVKRDLDSRNYLKAFSACRKHRIDMNVIVDHDQAAFLDGLSSFIEQVDDVDHINLFLTSLGRGAQPPATIAKLCDSIRSELEARDLTRYVNAILTAYVVKTPPDHESALQLLLRLRESDPNLVEDAVKYIIFLVDANSLFDTALGMYDFALVLMIAQHSQKDPREYLPFLRELRALPKFHQRFKIDDHLQRFGSALRNLSLAGSDHFNDAMAYVEHHQLYEEALSIWKDSECYQSVLNIYGDWLFERREFTQAALVFTEAHQPPKVMVAYEKALNWQDLFELATRENIGEEEISSMGYRVAEDLISKKRHSEAARVLLDYAQDSRQAVIALVQGNSFSEARRITTLVKQPELLMDIIHPGALESRAQVAEDINEMREQLRKQLNRIQELRIKKVEEPDSFYGTEDTNLHNVDVMTDASMPFTAFTRYTVAPTSVSKTSKRSSRSKRKLERKVGSGRKGTVDEEEYLLRSVVKLVDRFNSTQAELGNLLPHLLAFTEEHRVEGRALQDDFGRFEVELKNALEEIWEKQPGEDETAALDTWASRMQEKEKERRINPTERVAKPGFTREDWRVKPFQW